MVIFATSAALDEQNIVLRAPMKKSVDGLSEKQEEWSFAFDKARYYAHCVSYVASLEAANLRAGDLGIGLGNLGCRKGVGVG